MATLAITDTLDDSGERILDIQAAAVQLVDASNQFYNSGNEIIVCDNQSAGSRVLTVKGQPDPYGRGGSGVGDVVMTIPTLKVGMTGFFNPASFNNGGILTFTVDAVLTTKVAILRLRKLR